MITLIHRNAFFLRDVPPNVAYYLDGRAITWADVMQKRRERQARILEGKRRNHEGEWHVVRVSVRYFDMFIMGGWHVYIDGAGGLSEWVRYEGQLSEKLMQLFPLRDGLFPVESWEHWKEVFAEAYPKGKFDKKPRGVRVVWARVTGTGAWASVHDFALIKPESCVRNRNTTSRGERIRISNETADDTNNSFSTRVENCPLRRG